MTGLKSSSRAVTLKAKECNKIQIISENYTSQSSKLGKKKLLYLKNKSKSAIWPKYYSAEIYFQRTIIGKKRVVNSLT